MPGTVGVDEVEPGGEANVTSPKAITIAEPEDISYQNPTPVDDQLNGSQSQASKQYRIKSARRLTGRLSIERIPLPMTSLSNFTQSPGTTAGTEDSVAPDTQQKTQSSDSYDWLFNQVKAWVQEEKSKQRASAASSSAATDDRGPYPADGSIDDKDLKQEKPRQSINLALEKLEEILNQSMALTAKPASTSKEQSYFPRRKSSAWKLRKSSLIAPSSDTEYQDGDPIVPSTDVVLDNSKAMGYSGGSADSETEAPQSLRMAKEKEGWLVFKNEIVRLAHTLGLKGWRRVPLERGGDIDVQRLSGALTNAVYVVSPPNNLPQSSVAESITSLTSKKQPPKLLLRVYGPQVDHLIDRESELQILRRLARKKIGPRLLGTFENGRFEEYYNAKTLTPEDLRIPETSMQIAKRMRELHDGIELLDEERKAGPFVWRNWDKWVCRCEEVITWLDEQILGHEGPIKSKSEAWKTRGLVCGVEWSRFRKSVDRYRKWLEEQYGGKESVFQSLVFAHNDTQYGNLLRLEPSGESPLLLPANEHKRLVVIDFEYANANTPGMEFANHFTEWCYNYHSPVAPHACTTTAYPSPEEQYRFVNAYVQHRPSIQVRGSGSPNAEPSSGPSPAPSSSVASFMLDSRAPPAPYTDDEKAREEATRKEIERLLKETRLWRVANSAQWVAWGIVQAKVDGMNEALAAIRASKKGLARRIVDKIAHQAAKRHRAADGTGPDAAESNAEDTDAEADAEVEQVRTNPEPPHPPHEHETDDEAGFDYLAYAQDRALFFWGDLLEMGLIKETDLPDEVVRAAKRVSY